ncbi:hypothetical protein [Amnibacterium sp.]|uniref:hypothetical protein n=1 Tax=Amnibacterium sp. TaxID=1872496 RepID=UPI0026273A3D|nr:hypothetical protein [Amnibacterium sp.]MCU1474147.1 hypothetical protein [Amnibacterium sp.]
MLDYHFDYVALQHYVSQLSASNFPDPTLTSARNDALASTTDEPSAVLTGAMLHHLLEHASSDGSEVDLLTRAAALWEKGKALCDQLGSIRADLESALENPADAGAPDVFDNASLRAQQLSNDAAGLRTEVEAVRSGALSFRHLPPHPRQSDLPTKSWDWANLAAGRRTEALVETLFTKAKDPRALGLAVGVLSSYGANVAGSSYLGHVVGGPRRSQRYRDRLGRNSIGRWLLDNDSNARRPSTIADQLEGTAGGGGLPADLESFITTALEDTFDVNATEPIPPLQTGWTRLVAHLRLMDEFEMPSAPIAPAQYWMAQLWSDPSTPPPSLRPQDVDVNGQDGGGMAMTVGSPAPGSGQPSQKSDGSTICGIIFAILIVIDLIQAFVQCCVQWGNNKRCTFWDNMLLSKLWEQDPPDPRDPTNPNSTTQMLTAISQAPQAVQFVGILYDTHSQVYEALANAQSFLAITGLIYPPSVGGLPVYEQFTATPTRGLEEDWPHREEVSPADTYFLYPTSVIEGPSRRPSPFPPGAVPAIALDATGPLSAGTVALTLWAQAVTGTVDDVNLDLDADRGFQHPCWDAVGSVADQPIQVRDLSYSDQ